MWEDKDHRLEENLSGRLVQPLAQSWVNIKFREGCLGRCLAESQKPGRWESLQLFFVQSVPELNYLHNEEYFPISS